MKKIIDGREYNTETAQLIAQDSFAQGTISATTRYLYRKRNGEYFMYIHYDCDLVTDKYSHIDPLDTDYAQLWAKGLLSEEAYNELVSGGNAKVKLTLNVTAETRERLKVLAANHKCSISDIVDALVAAQK